MTFTPTSAQDYIAHFENSFTTRPFYYEASTNTINFGYGLNLTSAQRDAEVEGASTAKDRISGWFVDHGISISETEWQSFFGSSLTAQNGDSIAQSLNDSLTPAGQSWVTAAQDILDAYVYEVVVPALEQKIPSFSSLPLTTQWALESMYYNGPGTLGANVYNAANSNPPDLVTIAEQIAFYPVAINKIQPNSAGAELRYLGAAMLAMGVIPTFDDNNKVEKLDVSGAGTEDVIEFLHDTLSLNNTLGGDHQETAEAYVARWGASATASYQSIIEQLETYLISNGLYVVQPGDTGAEDIINDIEAILGVADYPITAEQLQDANPGASYAPGTILNVSPSVGDTDIEPAAGPGSSIVIDGNAPSFNYGANISIHRQTADTVSLSVSPHNINGNIVDSDLFNLFYAPKGMTLIGSAGEDNSLTCFLGNSDLSVGNLNEVNLENISSVQFVTRFTKITSAQLASFTSLSSGSSGFGSNTKLYATDAGVYSLAGKSITLGTIDLSAALTDADVTLIGGDQDGQFLTGGSGNDWLIAGNGNTTLIAGTGNNILIGGNGDNTFYAGSGIATMIGGTGDDTFNGVGAAGSLISANGGADTLFADGDIRGVSIAGIETLHTNGLTLSAAQFAQFTTLIGSGTITVTDGTYSLEGKTLAGSFAFAGTSSDALTIPVGGGIGGPSYHGGAGNDLFYLVGAPGPGTIDGGAGTDTFQGSGDLATLAFTNMEILQTGSAILTAGQLDSFDSLELSDGFTAGTLAAISGGTYSLAGKTTARFDIFATTNQDTTLEGNDADGEVLIVNGNGNNIITAGNGNGVHLIVNGNGNNSLSLGNGTGNRLDVNGSGQNALTGGSGDDTFLVNGTLASGSSITGGGGNDILSVSGDLSSVSIAGVETLDNGAVTLTASQFANNFTALTGFGSITASGAGTYSLAGRNIIGNYSLNSGTGSGATLIANDAGSTLFAGSGNNTLVGGAGDDFLVAFQAGAGTTINGGTGNDVLVAGSDITQLSIGSDVETLDLAISGSVKLTAAQLGNFSTIYGPLVFDPVTGTLQDGTGILYATTAGTYSLAGKTLSGNIVLDNSLVTGDSMLVAADSGATLKAGSGNDILIGGAGNDTLVAGSGNNSMTGGNGNNTYTFTDPNSTSTYLVNNFHTDTGISTIQLAAGVAPGDVTVTRIGDDLQLDWVNDPILIQNYFLGDAYKIASVSFADGTVWSASHLEELAGASGYTVVDGGDGDFITINAGLTGNYRLIAGTGWGVTLNAADSAGNNILTAEGDYATLTVEDSTGSNSLTALGGIKALLNADGSTGNNILDLGTGDFGSITAENSQGDNTLMGVDGLALALSVEGSSGDNTLTIGYGYGAVLNADNSSGSNTMTVGDGPFARLTAQESTGNNILRVLGDGSNLHLLAEDSEGDNILEMGDGNNSTLSVARGIGDNTLNAGNGSGNTLNAEDTIGTNILTIGDGDVSTLTAQRSSGNNTFTAGTGGSNTLSVDDSTGDNSLTAHGQYVTLSAANTTGTNSLTATNGNGAWLDASGSTGNNSLTLGDGNYSTLTAEDSFGDNTLTVGDGSGRLLNVAGSSGNNTLTSDIGWGDTLNADGSMGNNVLTVGNIEYATLTAQNSQGNNTLTAGTANNITLTVAGSSGDNTLTVGDGYGDSLVGGNGNDTLTIGSGSYNTLNGGNGNDTYRFGSTFGVATIDNQNGSGSDTISFGAGIDNFDLWFAQNGNDLEIDLLGTGGEITLQNWYGSDSQKVDEFVLFNGETLERSSVDQLVQAMAGFDPQSLGSISAITDLPQAVQTTLAASWQLT